MSSGSNVVSCCSWRAHARAAPDRANQAKCARQMLSLVAVSRRLQQVLGLTDCLVDAFNHPAKHRVRLDNRSRRPQILKNEFQSFLYVISMRRKTGLKDSISVHYSDPMLSRVPGIVIRSLAAWLCRLRMSRHASRKGNTIRARSSLPVKSSLTLPSNTRPFLWE